VVDRHALFEIIRATDSVLMLNPDFILADGIAGTSSR
jgi:hypothetical protein